MAFESAMFNQERRSCWYANKIWKCRSQDSESAYLLQPTETIQFTSNKTTYLGKLCFCDIFDPVYGFGRKCDASATVDLIEMPIQLSDSSIEKRLHSEDVDFSDNVEILFPSPVLIKQDISYEIRLKFSEINGLKAFTCSTGLITSPNGLQITFKDATSSSGGDHNLVSGMDFLDVEEEK